MPELTVGEGGSGGACGAYGVGKGAVEQSLLEGVLGVFVGYMAYLVAYDAEELVVGHHVHDAGVDAYAAVGAGEGVDVVGDVDLEVERCAVDRFEVLGKAVEAFGVLARCGRYFIFGVHLCYGLADVLLHLGVGKRHSLGAFFECRAESGHVDIAHG